MQTAKECHILIEMIVFVLYLLFLTKKIIVFYGPQKQRQYMYAN